MNRILAGIYLFKYTLSMTSYTVLSDASLLVRSQHKVDDQGQAPRSTGEIDATIVVFFDAGEYSLHAKEIGVLKEWVGKWNTNGRTLCIGGAESTQQAMRSRRFDFVVARLEDMGVQSEAICLHNEPSVGDSIETDDDRLADCIWLKYSVSRTGLARNCVPA